MITSGIFESGINFKIKEIKKQIAAKPRQISHWIIVKPPWP